MKPKVIKCEKCRGMGKYMERRTSGNLVLTICSECFGSGEMLVFTQFDFGKRPEGEEMPKEAEALMKSCVWGRAIGTFADDGEMSKP